MDRDQLNSVASFPSYINAIARLRQLSQLPIPIDNHGTYLDLIRLTDMSPDRMHSRKNQATKPPKPTRYRPRHQSLRDLGEEATHHGFMSRVNSPLSPMTSATYLVMGEGESHSISLTNENFPTAFSYGERSRQVTPGPRNRKSSSSASSSTSSSVSPVYSSTSNFSSPSPCSLSPNPTNLEDSRHEYIAPQNFSNPLTNPTQDIPSGARFMAHSTMQQYDPSLWFPTLQHGEYNDYPEGNVDNSSPLDGPNQLTNAGYPGEFGCPLSGQDEPLSNTFNSGIDSNSISLLVDQQNYDQFSFMNQPVAPTTRAPTSSSSISSGGEPYGYLPGFMYPGSQQIPHTVSNNAMHMHGHDQQNLHIYAQGYEDSSIIANDPNTPRLPDYFYRN